MFPGKSTILRASAHIGHGADHTLGAEIGRNVMVGMNSVIMDEVIIGDECIIGALTFVKAGQNFPSRSLIVGNPARVIKQVSDEMISWKTEGTKLYQQLPSDCHQTLKPCEPLRSVPSERPKQPILYNFFKKQN